MAGREDGNISVLHLMGSGHVLSLSLKKKSPFKIWGEKVSKLDSGLIYSDAIPDHSHV